MKIPKYIKIAVPIVIIVLLSVGLYFYFQHKNAPLTNQQEAAALKDKLSKVIELPDENPVLALVTDKSMLSGQPFFMHAENGDKVLIFMKAKKAILYRPSSKKIIEVGPVVTK